MDQRDVISTCTRGVIVKLSGFSQTGLGTLTGPDGNEQDTEDFLIFITNNYMLTTFILL